MGKVTQGRLTWEERESEMASHSHRREWFALVEFSHRLAGRSKRRAMVWQQGELAGRRVDPSSHS